MRKAVTSSVGSRGVKSAALHSVVGLMELSVDDGDASSSPLGFPVLRSCGVDPERCG